MAISETTSIHGDLWLTFPGGGRLSQERLRLLEAINATGSISGAARNVGLSYKAAWDTVNAVNNLADTPLVKRQAGGSHGGGSVLTEAGQRFVETFRRIDQEQRRLLSAVDRRMRDDTGFFRLLQRFAMRTSARNQLQGRIHAIKHGAVETQVTLALNDHDRLVALITNDSADTLALREGDDAYALIKASFVILASASGALNTSASNCLSGTVAAVVEGAVNTEVVLDLNGGKSITALVTRDSVHSLGLAVGARAVALIKASHVILGIA